MTHRSVLVTGAAGFLGRQACEFLAARGWTVYGMVRRDTASLAPGTIPVYADLTDRVSVAGAVAGKTSVVHLAARVHVMRDSHPNPLKAFERVNAGGTRNLVEGAVAAGVTSFVFTSSVKAAGEQNERPWTELDDPHPQDEYGLSKLRAEKIVLGESELRAAVLRLPLVYGPGMRGNMLQLFELVERGIPLPVASLRNRRSLVFSGNVVAALDPLLGRPPVGGLFYVADRETPSTPELARAIARALGRPARLFPFPESGVLALGRVLASTPLPLARRPSAIIQRLASSLTVDTSKIERELGFCPPYSLAEGLQLTADWYRGRA